MSDVRQQQLPIDQDCVETGGVPDAPRMRDPDTPETGRHDQKRNLEQLLRETPNLWRGGEQGPVSREALDSGYESLNHILPGGGWPQRSVIEIVVDEWGSGELQVLLPLMADLSRRRSRLSLVSPPYLPYAPALHNAGISLDRLVIIDSAISADDRWWCAEKILRHPECGLMLVWPQRPLASQVRRLQAAAESGNSTGVIFHRGEPVDTPVSLRLKTCYDEGGISASLLKSRYSWQRGAVTIPASGYH